MCNVVDFPRERYFISEATPSKFVQEPLFSPFASLIYSWKARYKKKLTWFIRTIPSLQKTLQESQKAAPRTSHRLSRCQVVFTKRCHHCYCHYYYFHYYHYYYYYNLSFWVLSQFELLSSVTIWVFEFCHHLFFFSLVTIIIFEFLSLVLSLLLHR